LKAFRNIKLLVWTKVNKEVTSMNTNITTES